MIFLFLRFSAVKILPTDAVQIKKETLEGTLGFQLLLHGNFTAPLGAKALW